MTHIVRYEDLIYHKQEALKGISRFLLEESQIDGSIIENIIANMSKTDVYKPRKGKVGANL